MIARTHRVEPHRSVVPGIEAMTLYSSHSFPRHSHDTFGVGVMLSGAQRSWSVLGHVEAEAGDVIMVNPGELHDGCPRGGARGWRIIYMDPAIVDRTLAEDEGRRKPIFRPVTRDPALAANVARLLEALGRTGGDALLVEEALSRCLMRILGRHDVRGPRQVSGSPSVTQALRRLEDSPEIPVSLDELARACGITRFQLLRGFARAVGTTPHAYLIQRRVRLVRHLLRTGVLLGEAAARAGFADQSHMTRAFTRHFGITPGRYRASFPLRR